GQQPMSNADETTWIVFNGEIFNYVELRADLIARGHRFRTQSDTEVILNLYAERGADCVSSFNGQFAFALWDSRKQSLLLARDRLGVRPLFYTWHGGGIRFASEIKALLTDPTVPRHIDHRRRPAGPAGAQAGGGRPPARARGRPGRVGAGNRIHVRIPERARRAGHETDRVSPAGPARPVRQSASNGGLSRSKRRTGPLHPTPGTRSRSMHEVLGPARRRQPAVGAREGTAPRIRR